MKIVLAIIAAVVIVGSILADYKWKQWMASRKRGRE